MANQILFTPNDNNLGNVKNKIMVGANCQGFTDKVFVIDLENLPDPYNPLNLPTNTIRCKFLSGYTPDMGYTQTLVDLEENVWDISDSSNDWMNLFSNNTNLLEVLGANTKTVTIMYSLFEGCTSLTNVAIFNTSNVTDMGRMFCNCRSLTTVQPFDTSNVTNMKQTFSNCVKITTIPSFNTSKVTDMSNMFNECTSLTTVPLLDTSKVITMDGMFYMCTNVQNGSLALYQQASTQTNPPAHYLTFRDCGSNTTQGAAELAQIPEEWK